MPSLSLFVLVSTLLPSILAGVLVQRTDGPKKEGHFIIKTKVTSTGRITSTSALNSVKPESITYRYKSAFSGFAGSFTEEELEALSNNPNVEAIFEDGVASIASIATQQDAPWGLERISHSSTVVQKSDLLTYTYVYDDLDTSAIDVYVVDTGINIDHVQFQGRARHGAAFGYDNVEDDNGHGTHVAGTIGGFQFGVAKNVRLISAKVLDEDGNGYDSDIMSAFDWIIDQVAVSGRPSVINYSISSRKNGAMDAAAQSVIDAGIHLVVASGNKAIPVNTTSPGTVADAIVVGAVDINDTSAYFSNYGSEVDVHAPGVDVVSAYLGSTTIVAKLSGTSMAAPHVAGIVVGHIAQTGNRSPQAMRELIQSTSIKDSITDLPAGTINNLAFNGVELHTKRRQVTRGNPPAGSVWSRRNRFAKKGNAN